MTIDAKKQEFYKTFTIDVNPNNEIRVSLVKPTGYRPDYHFTVKPNEVWDWIDQAITQAVEEAGLQAIKMVEVKRVKDRVEIGGEYSFSIEELKAALTALKGE